MSAVEADVLEVEAPVEIAPGDLGTSYAWNYFQIGECIKERLGMSEMEWRMLVILAAKCGRIVTREEALKALYPAHETPRCEQNVHVLVSKVRKLIAPFGAVIYNARAPWRGYLIDPADVQRLFHCIPQVAP